MRFVKITGGLFTDYYLYLGKKRIKLLTKRTKRSIKL